MSASFDNRAFGYRPALQNECAWLETAVLSLRGNERAIREIEHNTIRRHLEWSSWPFMEWSEDERDILFLIIIGKAKPQRGEPHTQVDVQNLYDGVLLELTKPQYAKRDCNACKKWWYDDDTGKVVRKGDNLLLRPANTVLLCQTPAGCPKGTPEKPKSLSPKNRLAWNHFRDCEAVRSFPDDPIVRRNARIIRLAMAAAKRRAA